MKSEQRNAARALRRERGLSVKSIAARLGVSTSSVSLWVRDIELTDGQLAALRHANPVFDNGRSGQNAAAQAARARRERAQADGRQRAQSGDPLHQAGCMLYWAEGGKSRNTVGLANCDAELLRTFVRFLRGSYGVASADIRLVVHAYDGNGLELPAIEAYWRETLKLPLSSQRKGRLMPPSCDEIKRRKQLYGTAHVKVDSTEIVQSIYGAIQEYGGFERPEWLD